MLNDHTPSSDELQMKLMLVMEDMRLEGMNDSKVAQIRQLIAEGADINKPDAYGWTALNLAAVNRNTLGFVRFLVEEGADVNKPGAAGFTPLCCAAKGDVNVAEYLVEVGANVNKPNACGWTPLHVAAEQGNPEMVRYLIERTNAATDINNNINSTGWTPLHLAAKVAISESGVKIVKYLVKAGADINKSDTEGWKPLYHAVDGGSLVLVKCLVEAGADVNKTDLDWAIKKDPHPFISFRTPHQITQYSEQSRQIIQYLETHIDETVRATLKNRVLPTLLPPEDFMGYVVEAGNQNPVTTLKNPLVNYSKEGLEAWLYLDGRTQAKDPTSPDKMFTAADIIPTFSARNVFLVAARDALKKLDSEGGADIQAKENHVTQFDRKMLELELRLLNPESILCAKHYLKQFCERRNAVYLPADLQQPTPKGEKRVTAEDEERLKGLQKRLFFGSEEIIDGEKVQIPGEIDQLEEFLDRDGSIKPDLVKKPEVSMPEPVSSSEAMLFGGPQHSSSSNESGLSDNLENKIPRPPGS